MSSTVKVVFLCLYYVIVPILNNYSRFKMSALYILHVLGIDIKLHPGVLPQLSPLGRSISLQVQLGLIKVLMEMSMTRWRFGIQTYEMPLQMLEAHRESVVALSRYRHKC